ncbi:universal stress protein [Corynebacterium tuscaniense]|uniref:universal stress protein n=1 Tax=Corynebacterium tuscaniense TaxID=302449 RepID=UPI001239708B|nr:universal stress protein [Corynebacterium tuscaniense]KAA8742330.1 universal stress protein [Corynebacterium tuscaniense]
MVQPTQQPADRGPSKILVGYLATPAGSDALNLGIALARSWDADLEIVMVVPHSENYSGAYPRLTAHETIISRKLNAWLENALAKVPEGITATGRVVSGVDEANSLHRTAKELGCDLIILGTRGGGLLRRFSIGVSANALLHSSTIPIALAPPRYQAPERISRVSCMFGTLAGSRQLISTAIRTAQYTDSELRLISFHTDEDAGAMPHEIAETVLESLEANANEYLAEQAKHLVDEGLATTEIVTGTSVAEAATELEWREDEILLAGSSRLATAGRMFMGPRAAKVLRSLPIPLLVTPSQSPKDDDEEGQHE